MEHAQKLGLESQRQITNLIEEQRSAVGGLKPPVPLRQRAREGALFVAKQLVLHQVLRQIGAGKGHERPTIAGAEAVQGAPQNALARARFSRDQHVHVACRHLARHGKNFLHVFREADQVIQPVRQRLRRAQFAQLHLHPMQTMGAAQHPAQFLNVRGAGQNIVRARLHKLAQEGSVSSATAKTTMGGADSVRRKFRQMLAVRPRPPRPREGRASPAGRSHKPPARPG